MYYYYKQQGKPGFGMTRLDGADGTLIDTGTLIDNDTDTDTIYDTLEQTKHTPKNHTIYPQVQQRAASAMLGSTLVSLTVTPLDVVKVRMQAHQPAFCGHIFSGLRGCATCHTGHSATHDVGTVRGILRIGRQEGVKALYRGLVPTMVMAVPANVIYFVAYESLRDTILSHNALPVQLAPTVSGAVARVFAASLMSPLELVKTGMQYGNQSILQQLTHIIGLAKQSGPSVLFRGLVPTLWRDVPFSGIYWTAYELLRSRLLAEPADTVSAWTQFWATLTAGAIAGSTAAISTIPFDVLKTRQQVGLPSATGSLAHLRHIYTAEG